MREIGDDVVIPTEGNGLSTCRVGEPVAREERSAFLQGKQSIHARLIGNGLIDTRHILVVVKAPGSGDRIVVHISRRSRGRIQSKERLSDWTDA